MFPVVQYFCETWFYVWREEHKTLRRICNVNKNEHEEWKKVHNDELQTLYRSSNVVRLIKYRALRWARHVDRLYRRGVFDILIREFTGIFQPVLEFWYLVIFSDNFSLESRQRLKEIFAFKGSPLNWIDELTSLSAN